VFLFLLQQNRWELEDIENPEDKIWSIAKEWYKGWRSSLSATYKAYNCYEDRMKNEPEDIDIVEWHYLINYFGTAKFKVQNNCLLFLVDICRDSSMYNAFQVFFYCCNIF
jgi:hypothetical protein